MRRTKAIDTNGLLFDNAKTFDAEVISLGAGTQSTVMALLADEGYFGIKPSFAVFADTGWEPHEVYEHLWWLVQQLSYPVYVASNGNIRDDIISKMTQEQGRFASIPYYTANGGLGKRQCTNEYKIIPIRQEIRRQLGYAPRKHVEHTVRQWIGISTDEIQRMKESSDKWSTNCWPLVEFNWSRGDCEDWFDEQYPGRKLPKSACKGCPFTDNARWADMKENRPDEFADVVLVDHAIRATGPLWGMRELQYTHRSCIPLDKVDFEKPSNNSWGFQMECEGICGN